MIFRPPDFKRSDLQTMPRDIPQLIFGTQPELRPPNRDLFLEGLLVCSARSSPAQSPNLLSLACRVSLHILLHYMLQGDTITQLIQDYFAKRRAANAAGRADRESLERALQDYSEVHTKSIMQSRQLLAAGTKDLCTWAAFPQPGCPALAALATASSTLPYVNKENPHRMEKTWRTRHLGVRAAPMPSSCPPPPKRLCLPHACSCDWPVATMLRRFRNRGGPHDRQLLCA